MINEITFSAPYTQESISEAKEASKKRSGYMETLRVICEREGYNLISFRRWLHRNGIRSSATAAAKKTKTYMPGYRQFTFNVPKEYVSLIDTYRRKKNISRTKLVQLALSEFIERKGKVSL